MDKVSQCYWTQPWIFDHFMFFFSVQSVHYHTFWKLTVFYAESPLAMTAPACREERWSELASLFGLKLSELQSGQKKKKKKEKSKSLQGGLKKKTYKAPAERQQVLWFNDQSVADMKQTRVPSPCCVTQWRFQSFNRRLSSATSALSMPARWNHATSCRCRFFPGRTSFRLATRGFRTHLRCLSSDQSHPHLGFLTAPLYVW